MLVIYHINIIIMVVESERETGGKGNELRYSCRLSNPWHTFARNRPGTVAARVRARHCCYGSPALLVLPALTHGAGQRGRTTAQTAVACIPIMRQCDFGT